ncbi:MAG: Electron transport complex subunit RnfA [Phycisphaerae bacterium]|nr:Electron transport complex subunit RnfA [Phycisphaerae bacterium]
MDIGHLVAIAITAAVIQNIVLTYFMGICPFLGVSRRVDMAFGMGAAVTFVNTAAGVVTYLLQAYVLIPYHLEFLQYVVFIFVIAAMVQLVEMYLRKFFPRLYDSFGIYLPLITTNCAILGTTLLIWIKGFGTLAQATVFSAFVGVGFTLAIVIMAGIREELDFADVPKALRGPAITLMIAAILAMAFMGFAGIGG